MNYLNEQIRKGRMSTISSGRKCEWLLNLVVVKRGVRVDLFSTITYNFWLDSFDLKIKKNYIH